MHFSTKKANGDAGGLPSGGKGYKGRNPLIGRQSTVILQEVFTRIQEIQTDVLNDGNLPSIDHGLLSSAALELALELPEAVERIIERALQISLRKRSHTG